MKAKFDKMEVQQIMFETGDSEVLVNANVQQGNLSYHTQLVLNFSDLNVLINKIQQSICNESDISSMFESEKMYNGNLMYTLDMNKTFNSKILLESMEFEHSIKQIRA